MGKRGPQPRFRSLDQGCVKVKGHWIWQGAVGNRGQCVARDPITGRAGSVHRHLWRQMRGELSDGQEVKQTCGVFRCVNPWHYSEHGTDRQGIRLQNRLICASTIEALENDYPWSNLQLT